MNIKENEKNVFQALKNQLGYKSPMAAPIIKKVVVSSGTGKTSRNDKKRNDFIAERLAKITGQKPAHKGARQSIASFKLREGEIIGLSVTLRKQKMYDFLDRLFNIAIPRMRDFRGLKITSVDPMGNFTIGLREHNIFPETADEDLKDIFGLAVTIVTNAKNRDEAIAFFKHLGVPFKKT